MIKLKKESMVKIIIRDELYLYFEGQLIMKRWLKPRSYSRIFHEGEGLTIKAK